MYVLTNIQYLISVLYLVVQLVFNSQYFFFTQREALLRALDFSSFLSIKQSTLPVSLSLPLSISISLTFNLFIPTLQHRNPKISPLRDPHPLQDSKFQFEKVLLLKHRSSVCLLTIRLGMAMGVGRKCSQAWPQRNLKILLFVFSKV